MGGIVPYGYRKVGEDKEARLAPSADKIPGLRMSEVDLIKRIFRMAADGQSCVKISDRLNALGVPPCYRRDGREVLKGKRKAATAGVWRPGRVRNIIVNQTYRGVHEWGKRQAVRDEDGARHLKPIPKAQWIVRECPAIVPPELWELANAKMHANQIVAMAHPKTDYLLRGVIRCGVCGRTYSGMANKRPGGKTQFYYKCNSKQLGRGPSPDQRCPARLVRGTELEAAIWADLRGFVRKPGLVIAQLQRQMNAGGGDGKRVRAEIAELQAALTRHLEARKQADAQLVYGRLTPEAFDVLVKGMDEATHGLQDELTRLRKLADDADAQVHFLLSAEGLLKELGNKADGELTFEERRRVVEALVSRITVETIEGQATPKITVVYRFDPDFERVHKGWGASDADIQRWRRWAQEDSLSPSDTGTRADINCNLSMNPARRAILQTQCLRCEPGLYSHSQRPELRLSSSTSATLVRSNSEVTGLVSTASAPSI